MAVARVDIGNWLHGWLRALLHAVVANHTLHLPLPAAAPPVAAFLGALPGVGAPVLAAEVFAQSKLEPSRAWRARIRALLASWHQPLCCTSPAELDGLLAARSLGFWALRGAVSRHALRLEAQQKKKGEEEEEEEEEAVLHFRCGDAPASRHSSYHFLRYSGWREEVARLRAAGKLRVGARVRVLSCARHEAAPTHWERAFDRAHALERSCAAYAADLLRALRGVGLAARLHSCAAGMLDDFVRMARAPVLLSAASSMSFVAGFFGESGRRGGFQCAAWLSEAQSACRNNPRCPAGAPRRREGAPHAASCAECERRAGWMVPAAHALLHSEVESYFDTRAVIRLLAAPEATAPPAPSSAVLSSPRVRRAAAEAASEECRWRRTRGGPSAVVVTSVGGTGTTSLIHSLQSLGVVTNAVDASDGLKHMHAHQAARLPPWLGEAPLLLFVYDDPVRALLSFSRRGWANFQAFRLRARNASFPKALQTHRCVASARRQFIEAQRRAEEQLRRGGGGPRGRCARGGSREAVAADGSGEELKQCSQAAALDGLGVAASTDWIGIERHWDGWMLAACRGKLRAASGAPAKVIFAQHSRLWAHAQALSAHLGLERGCVLESLCDERRAEAFPTADGSERSLSVLATLNRTFQSMRAKQEALGDFALIDRPPRPRDDTRLAAEDKRDVVARVCSTYY
ncbi:hypothetical protein AB1Y20_020856 [Prymnesium parvum]|uniref:Uncharacterized protein n=1 Tax=Prymnesium parvum TaxID=97485 RepID=A0AB34JVV8_PRYPA